MTYRMTVCPEPACSKQHGVVYVPKFRGSRTAQGSVQLDGSSHEDGGDPPALSEVSDLQLVAASQPASASSPFDDAPRPATPSRLQPVAGTGHHTRGPREPYTGARTSPLRSARG